jgi:exodeoxyribonuclease III
MQIATWNVNSIRTRQSLVVNWLQENPVEVLCLQETKVIDTDFPKTPFTELGYHLYISGQKAYNGVAIFSRSPLSEVSTGFASIIGETVTADLDEQKRVITGIINGVRIVNVYVPNGSAIGSDKYEYKLRWLKVLRTYLQTFMEKDACEICICGDFNIALEDRDIHNPKGKENHIMASPEERQTLQKVLEIGLADAFRKFTEEGGHFSWWDYRSGGFQRNRGWRIDHHYLTPNLYQQATRSWIDIEPRKQTQPSDHTPVIVEF